MELTAVVPSVGLVGLLRACLSQLDSAIGATGLSPASTVVVDNGTSPPYSRDDLGVLNVELLRYDLPRSFAAACNAGARFRPARRYLFLNNDVLLLPAALVEMLALLDEGGEGICGTRLVLPDGTLQHCGVRFDDGRRGPFHIFHGRPSHVVPRVQTPFQAVTAAAMLVDDRTFSRLGGFDEAYPFGYEDVDFCLRARQLGVRVMCAQSHDSLHFESMSSDRPDRHAPARRLFFERWRGKFAIDGLSHE
jgi:GT2 family glycosyltransferase